MARTPAFRCSLQNEVSDRKTWNFDLLLSLLTDVRSAVILLDAGKLSFMARAFDPDAPEGSEAVFQGAAIGGRKPYKYSRQAKTPKGVRQDMERENAAVLTVKKAPLTPVFR